MFIDLLGNTDMLVLTAVLTLSIELVTVTGRFVLGVEVLSDTPSPLRDLTGGLRVHHSYLGIGGLAAALPLSGSFPEPAVWVTVAGVALLVSDLIHHFCVLWPITGHHEFYLIYPERKGMLGWGL